MGLAGVMHDQHCCPPRAYVAGTINIDDDQLNQTDVPELRSMGVKRSRRKGSHRTEAEIEIQLNLGRQQ